MPLDYAALLCPDKTFVKELLLHGAEVNANNKQVIYVPS